MNARRVIAGGLLALVAFTATACSSGGGSSKSAGDRIHASAGGGSTRDQAELARQAAEVCKLFDTGEVNALLKTDAKTSYSDPSKCIRAAGDKNVIVSLWRDQDADMYKKYVAKRPDAKKLTGLGQGADYSAKLHAVQFVKGNVVVTVSARGNDFNAKDLKSFLLAQAKYAATKV